MTGEHRVWPVAIVLYITIPLQIGLTDGLAAGSSASHAGLVEMRSSVLMQGCGPALAAGIAAIGRRTRRSFLLLSLGLYLAYLPVGFGVWSLAYRAASGEFPKQPIMDLAVFGLAALVAVLFVTCSCLRAMGNCASPTGTTVAVALAYVPLAVLDLVSMLLRLAGHRGWVLPVLLLSMAPGLAWLLMTGRRR